MKLLLAIICVIFCSAISNEIRAKRDLSPDVRNKLIEVLNKDRQEIGKKLNITMEIMKYDVSLERSIVWSEDDCMKSPSWFEGQYLNGDSLAREDLEKHKKSYSFAFFIPFYKTIGCSKDFKCSVTFPSKVRAGEIEKTMVLRGLCIFGEARRISDEDHEKINKAELPILWKYGDIIGVEGSANVQRSGSGEAPSGSSGSSGKGSGAGSVFSLIIKKLENHAVIGCSITLTVSNEEDKVEYFGACVFGEKVNIEEFEEKLVKAGLPPVSKYADLLKVDGTDGVEPKGEEKEGSAKNKFV